MVHQEALRKYYRLHKTWWRRWLQCGVKCYICTLCTPSFLSLFSFLLIRHRKNKHSTQILSQMYSNAPTRWSKAEIHSSANINKNKIGHVDSDFLRYLCSTCWHLWVGAIAFLIWVQVQNQGSGNTQYFALEGADEHSLLIAMIIMHWNIQF